MSHSLANRSHTLNNHAKLANIVPVWDTKAEAKAHVKIRKAFQAIRVDIVKDSSKVAMAKAIKAIKQGKPRLVWSPYCIPSIHRYAASIGLGLMIGGFTGSLACILIILSN